MVIEDLIKLYEVKGGREYEGEGISQLEHALQSAQFAEQAGAAPALVCAALLHDVGHLLNDKGETPTLRGVDDLHQYAALPFLRPYFPEAVLGPIRLHVDAKRYLCATRPDYYERLSVDSKRSLKLQGGVFAPAEAERFIGQPHAADAVQVRLWDDAAKVRGAATPGLAHFEPLLREACLSK
ncbi:MAG TPA: HD domain-containing protein [Burkholderiales bacterium]|nr:HD domain-containing protein [Burkholderiales bacterium]